MSSLIISGSLLIPEFWETIINKIFGVVDKNCNCDTSFYPSIVFIIITFIFSFLSTRYASYKEQLVEPVDIQEYTTINNSTISTFTGSILNIENIDVVVTSENNYLTLGDINGTSVSGRIRKLAASYNIDRTLNSDNILESIEKWKANQSNKGPYVLGHIIPNKPFNASNKNVKAILHAIALQRQSNGEYLTDYDSIKTILDGALQYSKNNKFKSIFIPIFSLGSGKHQKKEAVERTVKPLIDLLKSGSYSLDIYLGTYRIKDQLLVSTYLLDT